MKLLSLTALTLVLSSCGVWKDMTGTGKKKNRPAETIIDPNDPHVVDQPVVCKDTEVLKDGVCLAIPGGNSPIDPGVSKSLCSETETFGYFESLESFNCISRPKVLPVQGFTSYWDLDYNKRDAAYYDFLKAFVSAYAPDMKVSYKYDEELHHSGHVDGEFFTSGAVILENSEGKALELTFNVKARASENEKFIVQTADCSGSKCLPVFGVYATKAEFNRWEEFRSKLGDFELSFLAYLNSSKSVGAKPLLYGEDYATAMNREIEKLDAQLETQNGVSLEFKVDPAGNGFEGKLEITVTSETLLARKISKDGEFLNCETVDCMKVGDFAWFSGDESITVVRKIETPQSKTQLFERFDVFSTVGRVDK